MKSVRLLNLPAVYRYKDQLQLAEEYEFNGWASPEPPFTVRLRVKGTPHIHALKEAPPDFKGFMVVEERGDVAVFEFKANCETSITPWVLKLGKVAEVLAPPELRETIRTEVEAMVEAYCAHY